MSIGKFISIEGQDGAGKTTNLDFICKCLKSNNIDYIVTREPGGTELGESIRQIILESNTDITPVSELLLMFAARAQHVEQVIKPALNAGKWVISDRFTDATYAYQGGGHALDVKLIEQAESLAISSFLPDMTILLDLDVSIGMQRTNARGEEKDRFENQADAFKQRVRDVYLNRQQSDPERIKVIDASKPLEDVYQQISSVLDQFMAKASSDKRAL